MRLLYLAFFGLCGIFSRYYLGNLISKNFLTTFPIGTFAVNIIGCFLMGIIYVIGVERLALSADLRFAITVGFLGGFTTFSSFAIEAFSLIEVSDYLYASMYFVLSPILGLIAAYLGLFISRSLVNFLGV